MITDAAFFKKSVLFAGTTEREFAELAAFLSPRSAEFGKGEYLPQGETRFFGLVTAGSVLLLRDDHRGDRNLILRVRTGETFFVSQALSAQSAGMDAVAEEKTRVVWFSAEKALDARFAECAGHCKFLKNLLLESARNERLLCEKITHMGRRTTRQKLMSYLASQSRERGSLTFDIPFSRQQLADYLSVDRSAMSAELSALARDGYIKYDRSHFELTGRG